MSPETWGEGAESAPIPVKVNGETVGNADAEDILKDVVSEYADSHGLRTYNVLVNGSKVGTEKGGSTLAQLNATSVELVAKDARGSL